MVFGVVVGDPGDTALSRHVIRGVDGVINAAAVCRTRVAKHRDGLGVGVPGPDVSGGQVFAIDLGAAGHLLNDEGILLGEQGLDGCDVGWWDVLCCIETESGDTERELVV